MSNFEKYLSNGLPLGEASAFFLRLKTAGVEKEANGMMGAGPAAATQPPKLPSTGMGQNPVPPPTTPLPPTAMGDNKVAAATPEERAEANVKTKHETHKRTSGERAGGHIGTVLGALTGGAAGSRLGKSPHVTAAGVLVGAAGGRSLGKDIGRSADMKKASSAMKLALDALGMQPAEPAGVQPALDPDTAAYVQNEQQAMQAEEAGHAEVLRGQVQNAQATAEQAQQQLQEMQGQVEQTQAQMDQYRQAVADATNQAVAAQDEALKNQQAAAAMRMAFQQLRGQLLQVASSEPPALSPEQSAMAAVPPGMDPNAAGAAPTQGAPTAPAGPAGGAPTPELPANAAPPSGEPGSQPQEAQGTAQSSSGGSGNGAGVKPGLSVSIKSNDGTKEGSALPFVTAGRLLRCATFS